MLLLERTAHNRSLYERAADWMRGSVSDHDVRHLRWLRHAIGSDLLEAAVVTTGPYAYRCQDGIAVIPAALLGPRAHASEQL